MGSETSTEALSQAALAKRLGVSRQYVNQLVLRGIIEIKDGRIDVAKAVRAIEGDDPAAMSYHVARTLKEKYAALHRKLDYERALGQVIPVDEVVAALEQLIAAFRARCLSLPSKLAPRLSVINDSGKIKAILTAGLHEALQELSQFDLARIASPGRAQGGARREPPAGANGKSVGRPKPALKPGGQRRARTVPVH
jgi:transcriptional regulator with XRE-family HTH domain